MQWIYNTPVAPPPSPENGKERETHLQIYTKIGIPHVRVRPYFEEKSYPINNQ